VNKIISLAAIVALSFLPSAFAAANAGLSGKVIEAINSGGYAYVLVDLGNEKRWFAGPSAQINEGDVVSFKEEGIAMSQFHSKSLDRDFDVIYFVNTIVNGSTTGTGANGASLTSVTEKIARAEGGKTVAEIVQQKESLSGNSVTFRGKVVKFSPQIMKTNWLHIQDGTADPESGINDITVTTNGSARVGDIVTIKGIVTLDKDFGYGYHYDLIVEQATVTEK
jgi:hypothetical protein